MADIVLGQGSSVPSTMRTRYRDVGDTTHARVEALAPSEIHLGEIGGRTVLVKQNFTRPNNATQYAAGDVVSDSITTPTTIDLDGCARVNGGRGVILKVLMVDSANQTTKGNFELWVFTHEPTIDNDNSPWTPNDTECGYLVDIIPLSTTYVGDASAGAGGNVVFRSDIVEAGFTCQSGMDRLFGVLVVRNAYTPLANENFQFIVEVLQD